MAPLTWQKGFSSVKNWGLGPLARTALGRRRREREAKVIFNSVSRRRAACHATSASGRAAAHSGGMADVRQRRFGRDLFTCYKALRSNDHNFTYNKLSRCAEGTPAYPKPRPPRRPTIIFNLKMLLLTKFFITQHILLKLELCTARGVPNYPWKFLAEYPKKLGSEADVREWLSGYKVNLWNCEK